MAAAWVLTAGAGGAQAVEECHNFTASKLLQLGADPWVRPRPRRARAVPAPPRPGGRADLCRARALRDSPLPTARAADLRAPTCRPAPKTPLLRPHGAGRARARCGTRTATPR
jgi:hypothetical protein